VPLGGAVESTFLGRGALGRVSRFSGRAALGGVSEALALDEEEAAFFDLLPDGTLDMLKSQEGESVIASDLRQMFEGVVTSAVFESILVLGGVVVKKIRAQHLVRQAEEAGATAAVREQAAAAAREVVEAQEAGRVALQKIRDGESKFVATETAEGRGVLYIRGDVPPGTTAGDVTIPVGQIEFNPSATRPGFQNVETGEILVDFNISTANHSSMQEALGVTDNSQWRPVHVAPEFPEIPLTRMEAVNGIKDLTRSPIKAPEGARGTVRTERAKVIEFETVGEAEQVAAALESFEQQAANASRMTDEQFAEWRTNTGEIEEALRSGDRQVLAAAMENTNINLNHIYRSSDSKVAILAMAEDINLPPSVTRAQTRQLARTVFPDLTEEQAVKAAAEYFGSTVDLPQRIIALRGMLNSMGNRVLELSRLAERTTGVAHKLNMERLGAAMENMLDMQYAMQGNASNAGRLLDSFNMNVGARAMSADAKAAQEALDKVLAARGVVDQAKVQGDQAAILAAKEQLEQVTAEVAANPKLQEILGDEVSARLNRGRVEAGVDAGSLPPRKPGEVPEQAAAEAVDVGPATADELAAEMRKVIDAEAERFRAAAELEGLEGPFAPGDRVSLIGKTQEEILDMARILRLSGGDPWETLKLMTIPSSQTFRRLGINSPGASYLKEMWEDPAVSTADKVWRTIHGLRANAMLSHPATQAVNLGNNLGVSTQVPLEHILGGMGRLDPSDVRFGLDMFKGQWRARSNAWNMAVRTLESGESALVPRGPSKFDQNLRSLKDVFNGGSAAGAAEAVLTSPGRALLGGDEFFMHFNYDSFAYAQIRAEARAANVPSNLVEEWVDRHMRLIRNSDGEGVLTNAREFAQRNTFKEELGPKGRAVEALFNESEGMKAMHPFRRVLMNIGKWHWNRVPGLNLLQKNYREALMGGKGLLAQKTALDQMQWGMMVHTTGLAMAASGHLTGGGPTEPSARAEWLGTGHKPYTLTIPGSDVSISLQKMTPIALPLMLVADLWEVSGDADTDTYQELVVGSMLATANNLQESVFFGDMSRWMYAITTHNVQAVTNLLTRTAASAIPAVARGSDPYYREARTLLDEVKSKLWWAQGDVEPLRNSFGEPVRRPGGVLQRGFNPMTVTFGEDPTSELGRELYRVGSNMSNPSPTKSYGEGENRISLDLRERGRWANEGEGRNPTQSPYDRWLELLATQRVGTRTYKERLVRATTQDRWAELDDAAKAMQAEAIRDTHLSAAWARVRQEYPSLDAELRFSRTQAGLKEVTSDPDALNLNRELQGFDERSGLDRLRENLNRE